MVRSSEMNIFGFSRGSHRIQKTIVDHIAQLQITIDLQDPTSNVLSYIHILYT